MPRIVRIHHPHGPRFGVIEGSEIALLDTHPFSTTHRQTGERLPVEGARLLAPVIPTKIVCVGRNYADHAAELGNEVPPEPLLFLKPSSSVIGPAEPIRYPTNLSDDVQHEAELAVVIGALLSDVTPEEARMGIYGFTAANDVTARDLQRSDGQWSRAKGFDSFCPLGPAIATDVDPEQLRIRCLVDGDVRQDGTTADMVRSVEELVSYISQAMTLLPGDIVLTGTPSGVGPIEVGQTVRVEIEGIGALENPVVDRQRDRRPVSHNGDGADDG